MIARHLHFSLQVVWSDLWVGAHWDAKKLRLFVCPLPCVAICVQPTLHSPLRAWLKDPTIPRWREGGAGYLRMCRRYRRWPRVRELVESARVFARAEHRQRGWL